MEDCLGVCGGKSDFDFCGVCNGSGISKGKCDCKGNELDCLGKCGGDAKVDKCGVCNGSGVREGDCDCFGH